MIVLALGKSLWLQTDYGSHHRFTLPFCTSFANSGLRVALTLDRVWLHLQTELSSKFRPSVATNLVEDWASL